MATDLTHNEALAILAALSLHYPSAGHTPDVLDVLAQDVVADMDAANVNAKDFRAAVSECRRNCKFWPGVPDILAAHRSLCERFVSDIEPLALPETHPCEKNPAMSLILQRARQMRVAAEKSRKPITFGEAYERARREVQGATND